MLNQPAFGLSVLLLLFASGLAFEPATRPVPAETAATLTAAPAGFVALDAGDLAELDAASALVTEAGLAEARGELGAPGDDEFNWEYVLIFLVIGAAMAVAIAIN